MLSVCLRPQNQAVAGRWALCWCAFHAVKSPRSCYGHQYIPQTLFSFVCPSTENEFLSNIFVTGAQCRVSNVYSFPASCKDLRSYAFSMSPPRAIYSPGELEANCSSVALQSGAAPKSPIPPPIATGSLWATRGQGMTGQSLWHPHWWRNLPDHKPSC